MKEYAHNLYLEFHVDVCSVSVCWACEKCSPCSSFHEWVAFYEIDVLWFLQLLYVMLHLFGIVLY